MTIEKKLFTVIDHKDLIWVCSSNDLCNIYVNRCLIILKTSNLMINFLSESNDFDFVFMFNPISLRKAKVIFWPFGVQWGY